MNRVAHAERIEWRLREKLSGMVGMRGERLTRDIQTGVEQNAAACQGPKSLKQRSQRPRSTFYALHAAAAVDMPDRWERLPNHLA